MYTTLICAMRTWMHLYCKHARCWITIIIINKILNMTDNPSNLYQTNCLWYSLPGHSAPLQVLGKPRFLPGRSCTSGAHCRVTQPLGCWAQHDWGKEPQVLYLQLWDVICTTSTCYWEPWRSTQQSTSGVAYHGMVSGFAAGGSYSLPLPFKSALSEWLAVAEDSPSIRTWWWIPSSGVILKRLCSRMLQLASWGIMRSWESIRYDTYWYITYPQASGSQDLVGC